MSICFICLVSLKQPINLAPNPSSHLLPPQHIQCNQLSLPPPPQRAFLSSSAFASRQAKRKQKKQRPTLQTPNIH